MSLSNAYQASEYSKRDLKKLFNLQTMRTSLKYVTVDKAIAGRYYQEGAVKVVCEAFGEKNRRKALLVMATGSGKTRTVIALVKVLLEQGWVKNVLFLADRNSLVTQAKRAFVNLLPDLSVTNLCEEKDDYTAHCVFSTYQTMMNVIDVVADEQGKLFTCGHFDLVICDEAHRSIYNKYQDIFTYFDAPLVGLTATPKDEIDKNTYEIFELESGVPTYGYELSQAVKDGYLVDFMSVETTLKFIQQGIVYDELSDEDKAAYEDTFTDENGDLPESIAASALNEWIFNEDTIRQVLHTLMTDGLHIDYGNRLGKTIIFAKNHTHAEKILEVFGKEYPHLVGWAKVIDNYMTYAQSAIDEFSEPNKLPQIAISVDMLDTGIDVPEVLNLVFFKKVMSKAKFWQMIGRGTRLCPGLLDGKDKEKFYIFDFCGNFEFFRMNKGKATANLLALQGAIFTLKAQIAYKLQDLAYQTPELIEFRKALVEDMVEKVRALNRDNFAVKQHLKYVEQYAEPESYQALTYEDTLIMGEELAPLVAPEADDPKALRFDALLYGIELAYLAGKKYGKARSDLMKKVAAVSSVQDPAHGLRGDRRHRRVREYPGEPAGSDQVHSRDHGPIRHQLRRRDPVRRVEGFGAGERRFEELQGQSGVLCASASGRRRHRQASGQCAPDHGGREGPGGDPLERGGHPGGVRGRVRPEAPGRIRSGDRGHGHGRGQGGVRAIPERCLPGQPTDLFRESDCGIHRPQRPYEGPLRPPGAALHGPGQHRGGVHGFDPLARHPQNHRAGQHQRPGGVKQEKAGNSQTKIGYIMRSIIDCTFSKTHSHRVYS